MTEEILVAGGSGFVGINLTLKLRESGVPCVSTCFSRRNYLTEKHCVQFDFRNYQDCLEATKKKAVVVICAGSTQFISSTKEHLSGSILPNLQIITGLLEAAAKNNVKKIIFLSTSTVYQELLRPIKEDDLDLNQPPSPAYFSVGWTNRYLEKMMIFYAETYGINVVILRPTSIYGPHDNFDINRSHVIPALIQRAHNKEEPFEIWGSPDVMRDFVYVGDLVSDIVSLLLDVNIPAGESINICNGEPISIADAANTILRICGHQTKVYFNDAKPTNIRYRSLDATKYRTYFPHSTRTPFEIGIKETYEWYLKYINS